MTDVQIDLRVAELLVSRLCHDLVGPVGAVNNGMELLAEDDDPEMAGDAVALASNSARQASDTLQFFRIAYGRSGAQVDMGPAELRALAEAFLSAHKAAIDWDADAVLAAAGEGGGKLLLNLIALGLETLPRGGRLHAGASADARLQVTATGQGVRLRPESAHALEPDADVDDLTPRSVQAYFTQVLARRRRERIEVTEADGRLSFTVQPQDG
jgi:histidine phosphotransferase ChpT